MRAMQRFKSRDLRREFYFVGLFKHVSLGVSESLMKAAVLPLKLHVCLLKCHTYQPFQPDDKQHTVY